MAGSLSTGSATKVKEAESIAAQGTPSEDALRVSGTSENAETTVGSTEAVADDMADLIGTETLAIPVW